MERWYKLETDDNPFLNTTIHKTTGSLLLISTINMLCHFLQASSNQLERDKKCNVREMSSKTVHCLLVLLLKEIVNKEDKIKILLRENKSE